VNTFSNDVIGSVQSLLGTIVIAVFVITFVVQAFQIPSSRWRIRSWLAITSGK